MADWRASLTASERYDNIQSLTKVVEALGLGQSAFEIENEAYKTAMNREEYDAACNPSTSSVDAPEPVLAASATPPPETNDRESSPGITIGDYQNCHYIASGVTAEVYRAQARALKVIVETHNIEPHSPQREAKILASLRASNAPNIITLLETFRDPQTQNFVLVFPYAPLTLGHLLTNHQPPSSPLPTPLIRTIFTALFRALDHLHTHDEPQTHKVLEVGTGPYRAPETLFGDRAYGAGVDLWAAGASLAECFLRRPLFDSPPAHEDGSQLGLVLSLFQTLGTPTPATWPEAAAFRTPPFEMYRVFEGRVAAEGWEGVVPGAGAGWLGLVEGMLRFESGERVTAGEALGFPCMKGEAET
ncbi:kinase-like domain-containing protein [Chaetomium sp. MPI-CAGE-AT-0009]|nr:kinase-like domain-containing protein [Chaetomium sp. MPI-CAGE-AT-0009]